MKKGTTLKKTVIKQIRKIISDYGSFTTADVQAQSSPSVASLGGCNQLLEKFDLHKATAITYDKLDMEVDEDYIIYEDLDRDILDEILILAQDYEADQVQTEKRISN